MANSPTYDPNLIETDYRSILRTRADCTARRRRCSTARPRAATSRARRSRSSPPRPRSKAAQYTMETRKTDPGYCMEYGKRVNNYDTTSPFGSVTLFQAIQYSINSVLLRDRQGPRAGADRAGDEGLRLLLASAARDARGRARARAGSTRDGRLFEPKDSSEVDPGRLAFGQSELQVTPLADGDGRRRRREPRRRHAAVRRRARRRPRRQDRHPDEARTRSAGR